MSTINSRQSNIEFIPAICPSCGGELRVPENRETIKCMYCGVDIVLRGIQTDGGKPNIETIFHLGMMALRGKNYSEAYRYSSMALEIDPTNLYCWALKGLCSAWLSDQKTPRFDEAIHCIQEAIRLGLREYPEYLSLTIQDLAYSVEAYTNLVVTSLDKEYEEQLIVLGAGTSHVDVSGLSQLNVRLTDKFFSEYGEAIEKSVYFIWGTLPSPKIARKIRSIDGCFMFKAWKTSLDDRITGGTRSPRFLSSLLSTIKASSSDPFGDVAEQQERIKEEQEKINELREKGPEWNRFVDDWTWRTFIERVYEKIKPNYYVNYALWDQFYKEEYDPLKGYRVWCLLDEKALPQNFIYKIQNDYLLGIWLRYDENNRVIGFEFYRKDHGIQQCGLSEKELLSSLVNVEEAMKQKQEAEKVRIESVKVRQQALENEERLRKSRLLEWEQLPWWKQLFIERPK